MPWLDGSKPLCTETLIKNKNDVTIRAMNKSGVAAFYIQTKWDDEECDIDDTKRQNGAFVY